MKNKEIYALGVMSGTSIDGIDFSLIRSDGIKSVDIIFNHYVKFNLKIKEKIRYIIDQFKHNPYEVVKNNSKYADIEKEFNQLIISKVKFIFSKNEFNIKDLDLIGIHGNTLIHDPKKNISLQLGDYSFISKTLNKKVVANFRDKDISLGGEGAPLVPIYHQAIFSKKNKNIVVVNIGGISNFSLLIGDKKIVASDLGPGNVLIDKYCNIKFNKPFDKNGLFASSGLVDENLLKVWMKKSFLRKQYPKSFDNSFFQINDFVDKKNQNLNKANMLRTLTFFSAKVISELKKITPGKIDKWVFCGGGVKNITLMNDLKKILKGNQIFISDELGIDSDFVESSAFAFISIRTYYKIPSAFPETTGCAIKNICGNVYYP